MLLQLMTTALLLLNLTRPALAFAPKAAALHRLSSLRNMITITEGVQFDTIAREWRMKWSTDSDKASLAAAQKTLDSMVSELKGIEGVKSVQRVVCGGCLDFKVIVALPADKFGSWEQRQFAPEEKFLTAVKAIPGISTVETQTYTLMPVDI